MPTSIVIADGVRTPMAEHSGDFADVTATGLAGACIGGGQGIALVVEAY